MSNQYRVGLQLQFAATAGEGVDFDELTDRLYDELLAIEDRCDNIIDPDIAASLADLRVTIELVVVADRLIDAQVSGISAIRTALHTIEVGTPGWEAMIAGIVAPAPLELQNA